MIGPIVAAGWVAGWLVSGPVRRLSTRADSDHSISVVVPVRDEAERLTRLVGALTAGRPDGQQLEVIVVDDGSQDGSGDIARRAGAKVLATEPPAGWTGKAWACWQGASVATGEVLVFVDADIEPAPGFVARLSAEAARSGGMVSVQPTHRVERLYERASAVANVVALMAGTGRARPGSWWRGPVGFGPAIAVPRLAYLDAGGHGLVAADVAEDVALAHALSGRGIPVTALADAGAGDIRYRMYPHGWRSLVEGWTKNLAAGAAKVPPIRAALVALWITGALVGMASVPTRPLGYVAFVLQFAVLLRRAGRFGTLTAVCYPLPLLAFVALFIRSATRRLTGRPVAWRGRWVAP